MAHEPLTFNGTTSSGPGIAINVRFISRLNDADEGFSFLIIQCPPVRASFALPKFFNDAPLDGC